MVGLAGWLATHYCILVMRVRSAICRQCSLSVCIEYANVRSPSVRLVVSSFEIFYSHRKMKKETKNWYSIGISHKNAISSSRQYNVVAVQCDWSGSGPWKRCAATGYTLHSYYSICYCVSQLPLRPACASFLPYAALFEISFLLPRCRRPAKTCSIRQRRWRPRCHRRHTGRIELDWASNCRAGIVFASHRNIDARARANCQCYSPCISLPFRAVIRLQY